MITDLLRRRVAVRAFLDRPVPEDVLADMLEAARLSPSGGNEQPWRFGVVTDRGLIEQIADIADGQSWIATAPLIVVLCTLLVSDDRGGRDTQVKRFPEHEAAIRGMDQHVFWALNQEEHQTKIAGTHMALAAWEHGVGSCWVSWFNVKQLAELLHLPAGCWPSEVLVFGYPKRESPPHSKKPLDKLVFQNVWQNRV